MPQPMMLEDFIPDQEAFYFLLENSPSLRALNLELQAFSATPTSMEMCSWGPTEWAAYDEAINQSAERLREIIPEAQAEVLDLMKSYPRENPDEDEEWLAAACENALEGIIETWHQIND